MVKWYQRYIRFQRQRRRRFKYHSKMWYALTKDIRRYQERYQHFLDFIQYRIKSWYSGILPPTVSCMSMSDDMSTKSNPRVVPC